jgi:hypothetical protein
MVGQKKTRMVEMVVVVVAVVGPRGKTVGDAAVVGEAAVGSSKTPAFDAREPEEAALERRN